MRTLIVGVGNTILTDDGVGVHVVRALRAEHLPEQVEILEVGIGGFSLLDHLEGIDHLIVVDAIVTGAEPGTVFELRDDAISKTVHLASSHEADFPTVMALGERLLGRNMPIRIDVFAVEAADLCTFGEALTNPVARAIPSIVARIRDRISHG